VVVVYFRKLPFETNNEKFRLRRVKSKKISGHPGGNLLQRGLVISSFDRTLRVVNDEAIYSLNHRHTVELGWATGRQLALQRHRTVVGG